MLLLAARLFQYLMGANLNSSRIRMTTPVLTSVVPGAGPLHSSAYFVRFYLPTKFQASPPVPLPELNLHPDRWPSHCIAVRSFSGYARDKNVVEEAEKLAMSLSRSPWANSTNYPSKSAYSVAQYSSPFRIIGRVNEVWFDVDCKSTGVETYWNVYTVCRRSKPSGMCISTMWAVHVFVYSYMYSITQWSMPNVMDAPYTLSQAQLRMMSRVIV